MKHCRTIDRLSDNRKAIICDNCPKSDECNRAYTNIFIKKECIEVYNEIKEWFEFEDDEEEYEELNF